MIRRCLAVCFLLAPLPASAHAFLDGAEPRVGSESAAAPSEVVLHFSQKIEPEFSGIAVQNAAGASVTAGSAHAKAGDATRLAVDLTKLGAGIYTVTWHIVSVDAHKTQGKFHFTVTR